MFGDEPTPDIEFPDGNIMRGMEALLIVGTEFRRDRLALPELKRREKALWARWKEISHILHGVGGRRAAERFATDTLREGYLYGEDALTLTPRRRPGWTG